MAGGANTAEGVGALGGNVNGTFNTAIGDSALFNSTSGSFNIALGSGAGLNVTTAGNVICIGTDGNNVDNSCYIGQIFGATSSGGTAVFINSNGRLGTMTSSQRFKESIKPIGAASEALLALKPVTFRYKREIDPEGDGKPQFGLVAEDVEKVNPDLVVRDKEGKPYSVRYDQVNAMLLNEFLKEHRKVEELEATLTRQQKSFESKLTEQEKRIAVLTSGLQRVSARLVFTKTRTN
jgi:trimeric autotransporter adhesin